MTHKEMTAHIRNRIKQAGIKARVRLYESCGSKWIQVFGVTHEAHFGPQEAREIALIAEVNGLTYSQGMKIDYSRERWDNSGAREFNFVFRG